VYWAISASMRFAGFKRPSIRWRRRPFRERSLSDREATKAAVSGGIRYPQPLAESDHSTKASENARENVTRQV
jgi:hypothetical protein